MKRSEEKKVAIITGGTKGIGLGIAKVFYQAGYLLVLVFHSDMKNAEKIEKELGL